MKTFATELKLKFNRPDDWTDKDELLLLSYLIQLRLIDDIDIVFDRYEPINSFHHAWFENIHALMNQLNPKIKPFLFNDFKLIWAPPTYSPYLHGYFDTKFTNFRPVV